MSEPSILGILDFLYPRIEVVAATLGIKVAIDEEGKQLVFIGPEKTDAIPEEVLRWFFDRDWFAFMDLMVERMALSVR